MDRCIRCNRLVDTDYDTEFYEFQTGTEGHCEPCRDKMVQEQEEDHRLDDPRHGQAAAINSGRF
jgi:hypothetical protein